jgi:hypothetical protein
MSLGFIANQVNLGNFSHKLEFGNQELIIDSILESCAFFGIDIPNMYKQAMKSKDVTEWKAAISEEMNNLSRMDVWEPRPLPSGKNVLDGRWVFAQKSAPDGTPERFKARYVAKGFKQVAGLQFGETFAPTAIFVSLQLLLTIAAQFGWPVHSFDFVAAYLNLPTDKVIWVKLPEGFSLPPGQAFLLKKALYGTRQAARCWWLHL